MVYATPPWMALVTSPVLMPRAAAGPSGSTEVTATRAGLRLRDERSFGLRQAQAVSNISRDLLDGMSWTPRYPRLEDSFCGL